MTGTATLSRAYRDARYRATRLEQPTYRPVARAGDCTECFARQHETAGQAGARQPARVRREFRPGGTHAEQALLLCRAHGELWRERDADDVKAPVRTVPA